MKTSKTPFILAAVAGVTGIHDYNAWGVAYGLTAGSEDNDDDHDGLTNFQEYAFGLISNSGSSADPITLEREMKPQMDADLRR